MQQLRLVAPSDDGNYLTVLSDATGEYFALPVDDALRTALRPATPVAPDRLPRPMMPDGHAPAAALSPREIQVRVRAGELPEDLAVEAGVSPDRIARFASAVLQERSRVAAEARRARARRGGADGELVPFGDAVDTRFMAHGIDPTMVLWDAVREAEGPWTIRAAWTIGEASGEANWTLELGPRLMTPDDATAAELLSDRPVPPRAALGMPPAPVADPIAEADADIAVDDAEAGATIRQLIREDDGFFDQDAADDASGYASDDAPIAQVTQLSSFFGAVPAAAADDDQFTPADANAPTDQIPRIETDFAPAVDDPSIETERAAAEPTAPASDGGLFPAPGPVVGLDDVLSETMDLPAASDDDSAERRARIPSWDDILLGVRRKRD